MELFAAPPAELAAIADPSARGAALLLASASAGSRGPPPAVPFDLLLGLLTETAPGGESWPVGGKKLPLAQLDVAPETAALAAVLASAAPAVPRLDAAFGGAGAKALSESSSATGVPVLPVTPAPSAVARPAPVLPPFAGAAEQTPGGNPERQPFLAELAVPAELAPPAPETFHVEGPPSVDAVVAPSTEPEVFERSFSNDARVRAQVAAAASSEPRAAMPAAPNASAMSLAPVPELRRLPAQEGTPALRGGIRRLDSLGALTAPSATGEAPVGSADWFPAHVHAHGSTGTAGAAPSAPAAPQAPVDARLPDWHEAFAQRVQWLVDTDAGEARIKLNPPELGAVDVKISLVDDKAHVHLTAATAAARDELAQALPRLRELFTVGGLELGSASVHDGRGGGQPYAGGEHARRGDGAFHEAGNAPLVGLLDEPLAGPRAVGRGRIDVFA